MARAPDGMPKSCSGDVEVQENGVCRLTKLWETETAEHDESEGCFEWSLQLLGEAEAWQQRSLSDEKLKLLRQPGQEGCLSS